ncbi:class I SAM-dependent methyltransferase [Halorussus halophilus]|uniref:class I SAM-dependent methyltransferase n=1 Tax=Halorussus halophilus TaxID=2650975 RepID=UPI0013015A59|nr:class I SAM-dependent methyltransferase [Halorussus halophilus]
MVEKDAVRRSYDELAETYAAYRSENGVGMDVLAEFLDSLAELESERDSYSILDAGCGQGTPILRRLSEDATAVGIDFSSEQLRLATENAPDAALLQSDMTELPFEDDSFDAVVAYWSLIHVPIDDHQAVIDEFARVLRPGGRVLVCEGTNEWVGDNPDWLDSGVEMQWEIAGADETREQLETAGFEITDSWGVPETLEEDEDESSEAESEDDHPWTLFAGELSRK